MGIGCAKARQATKVDHAGLAGLKETIVWRLSALPSMPTFATRLSLVDDPTTRARMQIVRGIFSRAARSFRSRPVDAHCIKLIQPQVLDRRQTHQDVFPSEAELPDVSHQRETQNAWTQQNPLRGRFKNPRRCRGWPINNPLV
jgi:hypothetical protein